MIGFGWSEMLVIAIVLIVVVGPKDLPKMLRAFGRTTANIRRMAGDFQKQFDAALKEAELDDLQNLAKDARKLNPASELKKAINPLERAAKDVQSGLDDAWKPKHGNRAQPDQSQKPASGSARPATPVKSGPAKTAKTDEAQPAAKPASGKKRPASAAKAKPDTSAEPASTKPRATKPAKTGATAKTANVKPAPRKGAAPKTGATASVDKAKPASDKTGPAAGSKTKGATTS